MAISRLRRSILVLLVLILAIIPVGSAGAIEETSTSSLVVPAAGIATANGSIPWVLTAECTPVAAVGTSLTSTTVYFKGTAQAEGPAIATYVECNLIQNSLGRGSCSQALPLPATACVGSGRVNIGITGLPKLCVEAFALYLDGSTATLKPPC